MTNYAVSIVPMFCTQDLSVSSVNADAAIQRFSGSKSTGVGRLLAVALLYVLPWFVQADDFPVLIQRVQLDTTVTPNKYVAIGNGPFKDMFPNGVAINAPNFLPGNKFNGPMFGAAGQDFGSDGLANGVVFKNIARQNGKALDVHDMEITLKSKTNSFTGSKDGDDFDVTTGTDANGFPTLTVTAKPGKDLKTDESLWMKIPGAPPNTDFTKPATFHGKLTQPPPPPAGGKGVQPKPPSAGNQGTNSNQSPGMNFNPGEGSLNFSPGTVDFAEYVDGSTTTSNGSSESIIGASITLLPTQLIGAVPGAFQFADTLLSIDQGSTRYVRGSLTNLFLFADNSVPGFDSVLQGVLTWEQTAVGNDSRYLDEKFSQESPDGLFFRTNLLSATQGLTIIGESSGVVAVCGIKEAVACDVNGDGKIDINDINAIFAARNSTPVPDDPRDADGDGIITVNDARICVNLCTNAHCAP